MSRTNVITLTLYAIVLGTKALAAEAPSPNGTPGLIDVALKRRLCFEVYWWGSGDYRRGVPLAVNAIIDRDWFYARIEKLRPGLGPEAEPWTGLYEGTLNSQGARVVTNSASPESKFWDEGVVGTFKPWLRQWFAERPTISLDVIIPADCSPRYDPPSAEKDRMMANVVASVQRALEGFAARRAGGFPPYPNQVHVLIADFNIDYPNTYVLIEEPLEFYSVALHEPNGTDEKAYQREGNYIAGSAITGTLSEEDIRAEEARLAGLIRAHGIPRTIVLRDAGGKQGGSESTTAPANSGRSTGARR
jgi:hypothetical protein